MPLDGNDPVPSNELIYNIKRVDMYDLVDFISDELCELIKIISKIIPSLL